MARVRGIGTKRVSERLQAAIANLIRTGMGDARLNPVSYTHLTLPTSALV